MMTNWEAIQNRISCRAFSDKPIENEVFEELKRKLEELSQKAELRFVPVNQAEANPKLKLSAAMFTGDFPAYVAFLGKDSPLDAEKIGFYGEEFVLAATKFGLGTCWVAGTYDKKTVPVSLKDGEKIWSVLPFGYPMEKMPTRQKLLRSGLRKRDKKIEQFIETNQDFQTLPDWLRTGLEGIKLGPSAVNRQPVVLTYRDGKITAKLQKITDNLLYCDLGIAKTQFLEAVKTKGISGEWQFGNHGEFIIQSDS